MKKMELVGIAAVSGLSAVALFHCIHYAMYCRYKAVPEKSHCSVCSHRRICQKYHQKKKV